jgi:hypothetical protein
MMVEVGGFSYFLQKTEMCSFLIVDIASMWLFLSLLFSPTDTTQISAQPLQLDEMFQIDRPHSQVMIDTYTARKQSSICKINIDRCSPVVVSSDCHRNSADSIPVSADTVVLITVYRGRIQRKTIVYATLCRS